MKISVAICTWNRAKLLDQTLQRMRDLRLPREVDWDLLVVDNGSSDSTQQVLAKHQSQLPLHCLFEPKLGHSNARNCAITAFDGDYLIWTDDDVLVDADWLMAYTRAFQAHPDAAFFVGRIQPWFEQPPKAWMKRHLDELRGVFVICDHGDESRRLEPGEGFFGANMAFRGDMVRRYRFDTRYGRLGSELTGGDDTYLVERLREDGQHGMWLPDACVQHHVSRDRVRAKYIREWFFGAGRTFVRRQEYFDGPFWGPVPRWIYRKLAVESAKAAFWSPWKNVAWFTAFREAQIMRGAIHELRHTAREDQPCGEPNANSAIPFSVPASNVTTQVSPHGNECA